MLIHPSCIVSPDSVIDENVTIDAYSVIGSNPTAFRDGERVVTKNVSIEKGVDVGAGTIIVKGTERNTHIMKNVVIGHQCLIGHDCIVEKNVKIMSGIKNYGVCRGG